MSCNENNGKSGTNGPGATDPRALQLQYEVPSTPNRNPTDSLGIRRRALVHMPPGGQLPTPRSPCMPPHFPIRPPVGFRYPSVNVPQGINTINTALNPNMAAQYNSSSSTPRRRPVPPPMACRNPHVNSPRNHMLQGPASPPSSQVTSGTWHGRAAEGSSNCSSTPSGQYLHGDSRPNSTANDLVQEHFQDASNPMVGIAGMVPPAAAGPLEEAIQSKDEGRVIDLLSHGCNPNNRASCGEPLVVLAVKTGNENIVKLLVSAGADVNCQDSKLYTPLHHAAREGHRNLIQFLLTRGANMYARSFYGQLPISVATDPQTRDLLSCQMRLYVESHIPPPSPRMNQKGQGPDSLISSNPAMNACHPVVLPASSIASSYHSQRLPTGSPTMPFQPTISPNKVHAPEAVTMPPKEIHVPLAITMPTDKVNVPEAVTMPSNKLQVPEAVTMPTNKMHVTAALTMSANKAYVPEAVITTSNREHVPEAVKMSPNKVHFTQDVIESGYQGKNSWSQEPVVAEECENYQQATEKNHVGTEEKSSLDREIEEMEEKLRLARLQKLKMSTGILGASGKLDTQPAHNSKSDSDCKENKQAKLAAPSEEDLKAIRKDWHEAAQNGCVGCGKAGCGGACLPQKKETSKPNDDSRKSNAGTPQQKRSGKLKWTKGELLGEGAYGKVFTGLNQSTGELMAVKQLKMNELSDPKERATYLASLEREIGLYKKVRHKHIVGYIDMENDEATGSLYIFLDYVSGGSILSMLERFGCFSEPLVKVYTRQLLLGLEYLHVNKIVHRDIKGGNVLVDTDGIVKLADFGASKAFSDPTITDGCKSIRGSVFWMAPEVIKGDGYGRRADIWSVGCTVIEMLTASHPWPGIDNTWTAIFHIAKANSGPPIPENVSDVVRDFLQHCFYLNPKERPTATELLQHPFLANES